MSEALRNLVRRKVRTGLTVFGIVIGTFALTVMGSMAEFFNITLDGAERISFGAIEIMPKTRSGDDRPNSTTVQQLRRVDGVQDVANTFMAMLNEENGASFGPPQLVMAVEPRHAAALYQGVSLIGGRWLEEGDARAMVVGSKVAAGRQVTVGSTITWRKNDYLVVGVMAETNTLPDTTALVPLGTFRRDMKFAADAIGMLRVLPEPGADAEQVARRINEEVPRVHARSPREALGQIRSELATFSTVIVGGALMSAIVGGLAVVNTMVMSVNERTREIGVKKAVGADDGTIVGEYLAEACLIGLLGGLGGLWLGWLAATLLNEFVAGDVSGEVWQVTPRLAVAVVGFAVGLGGLAGLYPAWHAARLQPVQALRAE